MIITDHYIQPPLHESEMSTEAIHAISLAIEEDLTEISSPSELHQSIIDMSHKHGFENPIGFLRSKGFNKAGEEDTFFLLSKTITHSGELRIILAQASLPDRGINSLLFDVQNLSLE